MPYKFNPFTGNLDIEGPIITGTGTVSAAADGTAQVPGINFTSDLNTGIYRPGADQLAISTNGTGRLFVDAGGNVGVGTAPSAKFDIGGQIRFSNISATDNIVHTNADTATLRFFGGSAASVGNGAALTLQGRDSAVGNYADLAAATGGHIQFRTGTSERLRITSAGLVGIGTSSVSAPLHVKYADATTTGLVNGLKLQQGNATNGNRLSLVFSTLDNFTVAGVNGVIETHSGTEANNVGRLEFYTKASGGSVTERMRIDSSGNVGIGTTSPSCILDVRESSNTAALIQLYGARSASGNNVFFSGFGSRGSVASPATLIANDVIATFNAGAHDGTSYLSGGRVRFGVESISTGSLNSNIQFLTNNGSSEDERARITSSGQLLVGTTSDVSGSTTSFLQVVNQDNLAAQVFARNDLTMNAAGQIVGLIRFMSNSNGGASGTYEDIARIHAESDGALTTGDKPGALVFSTTADGASSPTERMRITAAGNIECNVSSSTQIASILSFTGGQVKHQYRSFGTGSVNIVEFVRNTGGTPTVAGTISTTGSATAYNTSSDYRLKENVTAVTDGITRLQQLKPARFNFIADPGNTVDGFIAHEVQTVVPEAITGEKDAVDDEGNPVYQGIDQSKLVPLLTAALQEAVAKIESLEARLTAAGI